MSKTVPVYDLAEADEISCKISRLNEPTGYSIVEAHRHNYYEILIFEKAGGSHMIDFDTHTIQANSLHFVSPGQIHALNRGEKVTGYVVVFSKEFMYLNTSDTVLNDFPAFNKAAPPVLSASPDLFSEIETLVKLMETEYNREHIFKENIIAYYISILLLKCKALLIDSPFYKHTDAASQQLMQRFNILLEEKFIQLHKVNEYADLLNVTPSHLSETIKKISSKTAGDLIHDRLILEAKRLLLHTSITAKELAYSLCFNDPSYFSRFFKSNTGLSPEGFRKEMLKKYQPH
ncbi:MAG: helix-turn-helix domain-containing protein [Bacteroidota bacterium]